jgi:hypothetical protein
MKLWRTTFLFPAIVLAASVLTVGCASHHYVRVDDPYYHDHHRWNNGEEGRYHQWELESHRDHRDYRDRNSDDQKAYWEWRHNHS